MPSDTESGAGPGAVRAACAHLPGPAEGCIPHMSQGSPSAELEELELAVSLCFRSTQRLQIEKPSWLCTGTWCADARHSHLQKESEVHLGFTT